MKLLAACLVSVLAGVGVYLLFGFIGFTGAVRAFFAFTAVVVSFYKLLESVESND